MVWEWDRLSGGSGFGLLPAMHIGGNAIPVMLLCTGHVTWVVITATIGALMAGGAATITSRSLVWSTAGFFYILIPVLAAIWLRLGNADGELVMLWVLAIIWSTDISAYFTGRLIGGPKLAPNISPGKTWSGAIGGIVGAIVSGIIVSWCAGVDFHWMVTLAAAVVFSIVGQCGDLAISRIKRHFHVKDSSHLIPGHGGVLDRLDSTMAVLPLFAITLVLLQHWGFAWL